MASDPSDKHRRLTPREILRRYMSPLPLKPTRRQLLQGLGLSAAVGCSSAEQKSAATDSGGMGQGASSGSAAGAQGVASSANAGAAVQPDLSVDPADDTAVVSDSDSDVADPPQIEPTETPDSEPDVSEESEPSVTLEPEPEVAEEIEPDVSSGTEPAVTAEEPEEPVSGNPMGRSAFDLVTLGTTGIVTSRLAMGSGTTGYDGSSVQTRMGADFTRLLVEGYERGVRFFETADAYGSHRVVAQAMKEVGRQNVTLLTKTMAETAEEARADLDRFMEELETDYLDIVLLHIRTSPRWAAEGQGAMEVLAQAKAEGRIRAHGASCHSLAAMQLAAATDWVDVNLSRINPFRLHMDGDPQTIIGVLDEMKAAGQATIGMKILGQGDAVDRFDEAIEHATRLNCIDGFTIGFRSTAELDQVADKISKVTFA